LGALSRKLNLIARRLESPVCSQAAVAAFPCLERFVSENAERGAECEMALDRESVLDGGVNGQEAFELIRGISSSG
jgi:hypothetical protein